MEIKSYQAEYQKQITQLVLGIQQEEFGVEITLSDQPDLADIPSYYSGAKGHFWIALEGNKVIGTIAVIFLSDGNVAIRKLFTDPLYRGKKYQTGLGLLQTLEKFCAEQGKTRIYLGTTALFKAAHRFYEKNGYEEINQADLPVDFDVMAVDSKFYRKNLN